MSRPPRFARARRARRPPRRGYRRVRRWRRDSWPQKHVGDPANCLEVARIDELGPPSDLAHAPLLVSGMRGWNTRSCPEACYRGGRTESARGFRAAGRAAARGSPGPVADSGQSERLPVAWALGRHLGTKGWITAVTRWRRLAAEHSKTSCKSSRYWRSSAVVGNGCQGAGTACHAGGREFESRRSRHIAPRPSPAAMRGSGGRTCGLAGGSDRCRFRTPGEAP